MHHPTLYHRDSKGRPREWHIEQEGRNYRAIAGVIGGNLVVNEWKFSLGKNTGKTNATTDEQQANSDIKSTYTRKLEKKYFESLDQIDEVREFYDPMTALKWPEVKEAKQLEYLAKGMFSQPKLDGLRCVIKADGMWSRGGKPIISCPHIFEEFKPLFEMYPQMVFDGELYNHDLADDFNEIVSLVKRTKPKPEDIVKSRELPVQFHCYDMPIGAMHDESAGFMTRYANLLGAVGPFENAVTSSPGFKYTKIVKTARVTTPTEVMDAYEELLAEGYEGQMLRTDMPYEAKGKRSKSLFKHKPFEDAEFTIISVKEGKGNWKGTAKSMKFMRPLGTDPLDPTHTFDAGVKGKKAAGKELWRIRETLPGLKATVRYQNMTTDGAARFGVVYTIHYTERW